MTAQARRLEIEIVLAFVVASAAFVLAALVGTAARSHVPSVVLGGIFLIAILAVAHYGGVLYALPIAVAVINAFDWYFLPPIRAVDGATIVLLAIFLFVAVLVGAVSTRARRRARASEGARGMLADEQAALRRVATLVAKAVPPDAVFRAVADEIAGLFDVALVGLFRYASDRTATVTAASGRLVPYVGLSWSFPPEDPSVLASVYTTGRPARIDDYTKVESAGSETVQELGVGAAVGIPVMVGGNVWGAVAIGLAKGRPPLPADTVERVLAFTDLVATAIANAEARTEIARMADDQAALRRVATLVARGVPPAEVFAAVAAELGRVLEVDLSCVFRYEPDATGTIVATWGEDRFSPVGSHWTLEGESVTARVFRTGRSARMDDYGQSPGDLAEMVRCSGLISAVGAPIMIDDRLWGAAIAGSSRAPLPADAEERIANFADLIATAISNAKARTELAASRARVVAAGDETRKRLERDLHDGIQQRLVSLALRVRTTQKQGPSPEALQGELSFIADDLLAALDEIREISRGIHPAILSEAGLGPALKALARRSAVPVALDLDLECRLEESLEAAAYYVASEALTNAVKHADATMVELQMYCRDGVLELSIRDDGVGGADPGRGSGIIGLIDRVEALGGTISVASPPGDGTVVQVRLPAGTAPAPPSGGGLEEPVALRRSSDE